MTNLLQSCELLQNFYEQLTVNTMFSDNKVPPQKNSSVCELKSATSQGHSPCLDCVPLITNPVENPLVPQDEAASTFRNTLSNNNKKQKIRDIFLFNLELKKHKARLNEIQMSDFEASQSCSRTGFPYNK